MNIIKKNVENSKTFNHKKKLFFTILEHINHNRNIGKKYLLIIKIINIVILTALFYQIKGKLIEKLLSGNNNFYKKFIREKYDSLYIAFNKSLDFIKNCSTSKIFKFDSTFKVENPKISVVIPMYNCKNYLLRAIKSIQFQNISDLEILVVDDKSTDDTLTFVRKIQNEDNRIKLIKNLKNMGILYTRSIGALSAKGKYLFTLDNDDMFLNYDIFDSVTKINEEGNFDIVEFKAISNINYRKEILIENIIDSSFSHNQSFILFKPELGRFPISTGKEVGQYELNDIFLWGKSIKTVIYQKALNKVGYDRYSRFMIRYEDIITNYMICNIAESFIFIQKYGIYHIIRPDSAEFKTKNIIPRNINVLYLMDIVIDFSNSNIKNKKLAVYLLIYFIQLKGIKKLIYKSEYYTNLFISCFHRILKSTYVSREYKKQITQLVRNLKIIKI